MTSSPLAIFDLLDVIDSVKICCIKLETLIDKFLPSSHTSFTIVNDVYFNLHSKTISDLINLEDGNVNRTAGESDSCIKQHKKYTLFIVIVTRYEPTKPAIVNNESQLKVKTCGKHRKIMLKSSFVGISEDGEIATCMSRCIHELKCT